MVACGGAPSPPGWEVLDRRTVPEQFYTEKLLKYRHILTANKGHFKYKLGSVDFNILCQNIRGVGCLDLGGARETKQEGGPVVCLGCCKGNRELWGVSFRSSLEKAGRESANRTLYNLMAERGSRRPLRSEEAREIFFSLMEEIWKMNWKHNIGPQCLNMKINPKGINSLTLEFSQHSNSSGSD